MAAMMITGYSQVVLAQSQSLETGEQFSISAGDKLSFDFNDGTCAQGYRRIALFSHNANSAEDKRHMLISMLDCGWGAWSSGKRNSNNAYIPLNDDQDVSTVNPPPLFRSSGWHTAELHFNDDLLQLKIDGKLIGTESNLPAEFDAGSNSSAKISLISVNTC